MNLSLLSRYAFFAFCVLFTLASLPFLSLHEWLWPFTLLTGVLSLIGIGDLLQTRHAVRRNYPILGNIRYLVEGIRPEIRQYLLEGDAEQLPFSRAQRSLVYARAKNEGSDKPFGTLSDVYQNGFEFISHSMRPAPLSDPCSLGYFYSLNKILEKKMNYTLPMLLSLVCMLLFGFRQAPGTRRRCESE